MRITLALLLGLGSASMFSQRECLVRRAEPGPGVVARNWLDTDSVLVVPLVIHVLYFDSSQQISDEQIYAQLESLNQDYQRLNEDREQTPSLFTDVAVDTKIRFCLANLDPVGNSTDGIYKTRTMVEEIGFTDAYFQSLLGGQNAWDPDLYLNIWVCEISKEGDIAGFASMPGHHAGAVDGVVIDYRFFGEGEYVNPSFAAGRTLTHEIGHWLGLEHTWGSEPGCDTDDGIDDTPQQFDRYRGCPEFPQLSCGTPDMYMNFMDLTDDLCMNLFTAGQKQRMRTTLLIDRVSIITSEKCSDQTTRSFQSSHGTLTISPNPASDVLEINHKQDKGNEIFVSNVNGIIVLTTRDEDKIDISNLEPGIYFLTLRSTKLFTFRFIKI